MFLTQYSSLLACLSLSFAACVVDDGAPAAVTTNNEFAVVTSDSCGISIDSDRELMIRDLSVVNDPVRTVWLRNGEPADGAWHFGKLMTQMAGDRDASTFVRQWLAHWEQEQTINEFKVAARPAIATIIDAWPKGPDDALDLTQAPFRLLAIVNRLDLRNESAGSAGEGRFVFGVLDATGAPTQFTVILEYRLPARTPAELGAWADQWHGLSSHALGTPAYNQALQAVTDRFAGHNADPAAPNGSAISQIRTNEVVLASPWELREFRLDHAGSLVGETVALTPDLTVDGTERLIRFINENTPQILRGTYEIPGQFEGTGFRAGASLNPFRRSTWQAPGVTNPEARHLFSVNTCNGCHGSETATIFTHVKPRAADAPAALSTFLTGVDVPDPVSGVAHRFADLARRAADLESLLCEGSSAARKALLRVH